MSAILRAPVPVTGAVEGLLCRGMPVINAHGQRAIIVEAVPTNPARLHELSCIRIDWSSPIALDTAIRLPPLTPGGAPILWSDDV